MAGMVVEVSLFLLRKIGLSENRVPQCLMVYPHFPDKNM
jgi:hypothetical protein